MTLAEYGAAAWAAYDGSLTQAPVLTKCCTSLVGFTLGDTLAQWTVGGRKRLDLIRTVGDDTGQLRQGQQVDGSERSRLSCRPELTIRVCIGALCNLWLLRPRNILPSAVQLSGPGELSIAFAPASSRIYIFWLMPIHRAVGCSRSHVVMQNVSPHAPTR